MRRQWWTVGAVVLVLVLGLFALQWGYPQSLFGGFAYT